MDHQDNNDTDTGSDGLLSLCQKSVSNTEGFLEDFTPPDETLCLILLWHSVYTLYSVYSGTSLLQTSELRKRQY